MDQCTDEDQEKCISDCLKNYYGDSYDIAGYLSPLSIGSAAASEFAEYAQDHADRAARRNLYSDAFRTGSRQAAAASALGRFSAAGATVGVGAFFYQTTAYAYCSATCSSGG